jgi:hypothetical protein
MNNFTIALLIFLNKWVYSSKPAISSKLGDCKDFQHFFLTFAEGRFRGG